MNEIIIQTDRRIGRIHPNLYGHFSEHLGRCIYGGLYVGPDSPIPNINGMRTDVVEALKHIRAPVLRWPGGCFADEYHWRDGIGDQAQRKRMVNTHWGCVVEDNSFGTHEFLELCRQIGCEPYHVFDLYKAHQGGTALGLRMKSDLAAEGLPQLHASASLKEGVLTLTVANTAATQSAQALVTLLGMEPGRVSGRVLSGEIGEYNHFAQNRLRVKPFEGVAVEKDGLRLKLPACSVVEVTCR